MVLIVTSKSKSGAWMRSNDLVVTLRTRKGCQTQDTGKNYRESSGRSSTMISLIILSSEGSTPAGSAYFL